MFESRIDKRVIKKVKEIDTKLENSFSLIRQDIKEMQETVDRMREFLKKEKGKIDYSRKEDNKLRAKFRKDVDDFTEKTKQLSLAFFRVREIENNLVTKKDLAKIEDSIRIGFKDDLIEFKSELKETNKQTKEIEKRVKALENGKVKSKKRFFFWKDEN